MSQPDRVTVYEVKELMRRGAPFAFVDARNLRAWDDSQVKLPGAIRVPAGKATWHLDKIPPDVTVVTYCTCPQEASSARVALELIALGVKNVQPLYGGLRAWLEADLPLEPKDSETKGFEIRQ